MLNRKKKCTLNMGTFNLRNKTYVIRLWSGFRELLLLQYKFKGKLENLPEYFLHITPGK